MHKKLTRIVTVSVLGHKAESSKANRRRVAWLNIIMNEIARQRWQPIDAILLPGGFFQLKSYIGELNHAARVECINSSRSGRACATASRELAATLQDVALIVGLDSAPASKRFGGDNFVAAWRHGELAGLARMIFPARGDTSGENGFRLRCVAEDFFSPARVIKLRSGSKALLCACYDMFALRVLHSSPARLAQHVRYLDDDRARAPPSRARRVELIEAYRTLVLDHKVDMALAAVHQFEAPGRDSYWQRHGIAYASAALGGGLALGAAHFWNALPDSGASTLAAFGVGRRHLALGPHRRAHHRQPVTAKLIEGNGRKRAAALLRLYEA